MPDCLLKITIFKSIGSLLFLRARNLKPFDGTSSFFLIWVKLDALLKNLLAENISTVVDQNTAAPRHYTGNIFIALV
jgi:hypothetical protein